MLLYVFDELFYIYDQVMHQQGCNKKIIASYKILSIMAACCTEHCHGAKKRGMPDALSLINVNDIHHLECLTWTVYDGALVVGKKPALTGNLPWCTVLASLSKHIYRGNEDTAQCPPFVLASWDCKERIEVLCHEGLLDME